MASIDIQKILEITPYLLNISSKHLWYTYDESADVLYLSFKKPGHADESELSDDDVIVRYEKGELIGITILNASKWKKPI